VSGQIKTAQIWSVQIKFKTGQVRSGKGQSRAGQEGQMKVSLGQVKPRSSQDKDSTGLYMLSSCYVKGSSCQDRLCQEWLS